jgi:hypothetical protein
VQPGKDDFGTETAGDLTKCPFCAIIDIRTIIE